MAGKPGRPKGDTKKQLDRVLEAINGSGGIVGTIAARLGVDRTTVYNYLEKWPEAKEAYEAAIDAIGDAAEKVIFKAIVEGSTEDAWKYVDKQTRMRRRGYENSKTIRVFDGMKDDQLRAFIEATITGAGSGDSGSEAPETRD